MLVAYVVRRYLLSVEPNVEDVSPIFLHLDDLVTYIETYIFRTIGPQLQEKLNMIRQTKNILNPVLLDKLNDRIWIEKIEIFSSMQEWDNS